MTDREIEKEPRTEKAGKLWNLLRRHTSRQTMEHNRTIELLKGQVSELANVVVTLKHTLCPCMHRLAKMSRSRLECLSLGPEIKVSVSRKLWKVSVSILSQTKNQKSHFRAATSHLRPCTRRYRILHPPWHFQSTISNKLHYVYFIQHTHFC